MQIIESLISAGFTRVIVLDGEECNQSPECSVLLAIWPYEAQREPDTDDAWIHPYYYASQRAYTASSAIAEEFADQGVTLRDDILLKPIFARLPGFSQGRSTLSFIESVGSRFHVQTLTVSPALPPTHHLEEQDHPLHCGDCRRCVDACPTNALENGVFHRERCIRNWQMSGKSVPVELRAAMGRSLVGCDICQMACPHNQPLEKGEGQSIPLEHLLGEPKAAAAMLRPLIGANLAIPNRILSQACLIAGCSGNQTLTEQLQKLTQHPSAVVAEHARWALAQIHP